MERIRENLTGRFVMSAKMMNGNMLKKFVIAVNLVILITVVVGYYQRNVFAYTDSELLGESLEFDKNGNLVMKTHDRKATTGIKYKTIGWVIKRYDMPMNAPGQQYVVIPLSTRVEYKDDPNNSAYVYCCYYGDRITIEQAIDKVSAEWKNQLYKFGDYVYIDEAMTVVEYDEVRGGLTGTAGEHWGEVYFEYAGIANARPWASKESLRTHFDKRVYFPTQVYPKYFKLTETIAAQVKDIHNPNATMDVDEGTRYTNTYDVVEAVPTGASLKVEGEADKYSYRFVYDRKEVTFYIPIKFIITYNLRWKAYDGSLRTEKKDVIQWYYVNKKVSYYMVNRYSLSYLQSIHLLNYAFSNGKLDFNSTVACPRVSSIHSDDYKSHIKFPDYDDEYHIDGGTLSQMAVNGVKPTIPDENRQNLANQKIKSIKVKNDSLKVDSQVVLSDKWVDNNGNEPYKGLVGGRTEIYSAGNMIPHNKENRDFQPTLGYLSYKNCESNATDNFYITGMHPITIHTPSYIEMKIEQEGSELYNKENAEESSGDEEIRKYMVIDKNKPFKIVAITTGEHINAKGYGNRDYAFATDRIEIRFKNVNVLLYKEGEEECERIEVGSFHRWSKGNQYVVENDNDRGNIFIEIRSYAKNYTASLNGIMAFQENANISRSNYGAFATDKIIFFSGKDETENNYTVVGTH